MRRSGSSCLLLSRYGSSSSLGSHDQHDPQHPHEPKQQQRITILSTERLPPYGAERYFILSELERNANSFTFLDCLRNDDEHDDGEDDETNSTECSSGGGSGPEMSMETSEENVEDIIDNTNTNTTYNNNNNMLSSSLAGDDPLPPYVMLYIPWAGNVASPLSGSELVRVIERTVLRILCLAEKQQKASRPLITESSSFDSFPKIETSADAFASQVERLNTPQDKQETKCNQSHEHPLNSRSTSNLKRSEGTTETTRIHIIVERKSPAPTTPHRRKKREAPMKISSHAEETRIAEELARFVALSPTLRPVVDGVTVGFTSEPRVAPGLETLMSTINQGATERRRLIKRKRRWTKSWMSPQKTSEATTTTATTTTSHDTFRQDPCRSIIGIVAPSAKDLLVGIDKTNGDSDAVQDVVQSITKAEWNACGDYTSFAARGQEVWKKVHACDAFEDDGCLSSEHIASSMVAVFLVAFVGCLLHRYSELLMELKSAVSAL